MGGRGVERSQVFEIGTEEGRQSVCENLQINKFRTDKQ